MGSTNGASRELSVGIVGRRLRRRRDRDQAPRGRIRELRDLRARRDRRRGLAREHLPGRRLRRPLAPLLVLVRPRAPLVAALRAAGRDPRLPRGGLARATGSSPTCARHRGRRGRVRRRGRALDAAHRRRRRARVRRPRHRLRPAHPARDPAPAEGIEDFEGPSFHSAEWDHDVDLAGRRVAVIGTGRERDPVRPRDRRGRRADDDLPALGAVDPAEEDRGYPEWERRLFRAFPAARGGQPRGH